MSGRPTDVYEELVHLRRCGQKAALATIVEVEGSIPSFQSAKLLVREDGSMVGTIGGGCTEAEVWNAAREVIETEKPRHLRFNLGQDAAYDNGLIWRWPAQCLRGADFAHPERFYLRSRTYFQESLESFATQAGFRTIIVDNRDTYANRERFPEAAEVYAEEYEEVFPKLAVNESSYLIIVTRGHRDDMRVLRWAVFSPARYIGMIGSKRKTIEVVKQLQREGIGLERLERSPRTDGIRHRRRHSGRDRRGGRGRDDQPAAQPRHRLELAVEIRVRPRDARRLCASIPRKSSARLSLKKRSFQRTPNAPPGLRETWGCHFGGGSVQPHGPRQGATRISRLDVPRSSDLAFLPPR